MTGSPTRAAAPNGSFAPELVEVLRGFAVRAAAITSWRDLARIPGKPVPASALRRVIDGVRPARRDGTAFLFPSHLHGPLVAALERSAPRAAALFRFASLGEAAPTVSIEALLGADFVAAAIEHDVFQQRADQLSTSFALIPFRDRAYLSDARPHATPGDRPVYIGPNSAIEIEYCSTRLRPGKRRRGLEIGAGTGIVVLELAGLCDEWHGTDRDERSVAFSRANARLHGTRNASFACSDLFAQVDGRFDLIVFNPWQPSESQVDLIERFVGEAPEHLVDHGRVILFIESARHEGRDPVLERIATALRATGMAALRHIHSSHRRGGKPGGIAVTSTLTIGHGIGNRGSIKTSADLSAVYAGVRRALLHVTGR